MLKKKFNALVFIVFSVLLISFAFASSSSNYNLLSYSSGSGGQTSSSSSYTIYTMLGQSIVGSSSSSSYSSKFGFYFPSNSQRNTIQSSAGAGGCTPTTEICDGVDNDCDGLIDEYVCGRGLPSEEINETNVTDFIVSPSFINVTLFPGENESSDITITNTGDTNLTLEIYFILGEFGQAQTSLIDLNVGDSTNFDVELSSMGNATSGPTYGQIIVSDSSLERAVDIVINVEVRSFREILSDTISDLVKGVFSDSAIRGDFSNFKKDLRVLSFKGKVIFGIGVIILWFLLLLLSLLLFFIKRKRRSRVKHGKNNK